MRGRWERTGGVGEQNIPGKKCVGSNPRHSGSHVPANQSATLANLSPNDQRHITTRTGSSSPVRFGKRQTGMPRVYTSTKASVLEPNGLPFKLPLFEIYTCKHTTNGANLCWETPHKRYIQASWGQKNSEWIQRSYKGLPGFEGAPQLDGLYSPLSWLKWANRQLAQYCIEFKMIDAHT